MIEQIRNEISIAELGNNQTKIVYRLIMIYGHSGKPYPENRAENILFLH